MIAAFWEAAEAFTPESYLYWSRIQGSMWTAADFVICWYLLRLGNLARTICGKRLHRISFGILALTVPFALLIPVAPNATAFYRLELLVTIPHFLLILYVFLVDWKWAWQAYRRVMAPPPSAASPEHPVMGVDV